MNGDTIGTRLTTHVLDTALGKPACGIPIRLFACDAHERSLVGESTTNDDGRTDEPLGEGLAPGSYEIVFQTSAYFARDARATFYDDIAVRFTIGPGRAHLHVPLLLSAFGYTTYRGS